TDVLADLFSEDSLPLPIDRSDRTPSHQETRGATLTDRPSEPTPSLAVPTEAQPETVATNGTLSGAELVATEESFSEEIVAAAIESAQQAVDEIAQAEVSAIAHGQEASGPGAVPLIPVAASDWAFEERLASHKEWVESRGVVGTKANLEGANLEGATLDTAMGLVPRQLAGANLHEASLPEQIAEFEARPEFERTSKSARGFFMATMAMSAISCLAIWKTRDIQLLSDLSIIPFLHSQAAAAA